MKEVTMLALTRSLTGSVLIVATFVPTSAKAQTETFSELVGQVKPGDRVVVSSADGNQTEGLITNLTASSLSVRLINEADFYLNNSADKTFSEAAVRKIVRQDSNWNGVLIGAAAGVPASWFYLWSAGGSDSAGAVFVGGCILFGGLGALVGGGVDALIHKTIYQAPRRGASVTIDPVLGRGRTGVAASLRF
jgi:hypothetical protein